MQTHTNMHSGATAAQIVIAAALVLGVGPFPAAAQQFTESSSANKNPAQKLQIPAGTISPVRLNRGISSRNARPGQIITARLMQDVPLANRGKIHKRTKVKRCADPTGRLQRAVRLRPRCGATDESPWDGCGRCPRVVPYSQSHGSQHYRPDTAVALASAKRYLSAPSPDYGRACAAGVLYWRVDRRLAFWVCEPDVR